MSKITGALFLLLSACAASGVTTNRELAMHAAPRFDPVAITAADTARVFPVANDPRLPSADRIARQIRSELGEVASADVRLCVAPDGRVQRVQLVRGSSFGDFDDALIHDVADWQFSGIPGTSRAASLQSCEVATISYRPHQ